MKRADWCVVMSPVCKPPGDSSLSPFPALFPA
jgi:hypothetical protein